MKRLALHLNDAGITLLDERSVRYREPGFALLEGNELTTGSAAFSRARINPRSIHNRYWSELAVTPLADQRFGHLTAADLAIRQLEQMWTAAGSPGAQLVVAVPSNLGTDRLGLLLGIAAELGITVTALVDAAVAATRREYRNGIPVHIDMGLHVTTLTRLSQAGQAQVERSDVLDGVGMYALYDAWLTAIAEAFVQQSRFDPLHTAETEQMLLDRLGGWLAQAGRTGVVELEIEYAGIPHRAEIESLSLIAAAAPFYQQVTSRLRALYRAGELPAMQGALHGIQGLDLFEQRRAGSHRGIPRRRGRHARRRRCDGAGCARRALALRSRALLRTRRAQQQNEKGHAMRGLFVALQPSKRITSARGSS